MADILLVEDDRKLAHVASLYLEEEGHTVRSVPDVPAALAALRRHAPDILLTDLVLGKESGLDVLRAARALGNPPDVLLITAHGDAETAALAMRFGAYEYVRKPFAMEEISALVRRIQERRQLVAECRAQTRRTAIPDDEELIAESPGMKGVLRLIEEVAGMNTTVLIRGESGCGKDVAARCIHRRSAFSGGPFVALNCGALPESLLASELFGHEKGAFTGASERRAGAFERADGGTLFLDEIGEMPESVQVHLLRVLEERAITRVGGSVPVAVSLRLIAATHRKLEHLVASGVFRQDLYYRIQVFPLDIPPLRERTEDIGPLWHHFIRQFDADAPFPEEAFAEVLKQYDWPGNVRELRNLAEYLYVRGKAGHPVSAEAVRELLRERLEKRSGGAGSADTLADVEAVQIRNALERCGWNKSRAAALLGITRRRLYSRMKILGIADGR